jgi:uncharacterized protein YjlB
VVVVPAGVAHCNQEQSADLLIVGGYPDNANRPDLRRGLAAEHQPALDVIKRVRLPAADPVAGHDGPLHRLWA